ncbi:nuclear transport factor 2 family protein [Prosthecobacter sp. SYSU 5D2]|uniref:nuclear transport factor 2 family protein n=1 Tax=Prosthecobacter sp. SYSU 5D2 TaxID=3134134 RepID=UPI0031FEEA78
MNSSTPQVLSDYFSAANDGRIDDTASCFAADALVHDENQDRLGLDAIRTWIEHTTREYQPKTDVASIEAVEDTFVAVATVSGTFPGSPIQLTYTFTVQNEKITGLSIR